MYALKLIPIGDAAGVILPPEILARLKREVGDTVFVAESAGGLLLCARDPALQEQYEAALEFIGDYRDALQVLAE